MVDLGKRLKSLRMEHELTQGQVGSQIGVTSSMISAYENGIRYPSYEALTKLVQIYGVSSDYILGISGNRTPSSRFSISLDGLSIENIHLIENLVQALKGNS